MSAFAANVTGLGQLNDAILEVLAMQAPPTLPQVLGFDDETRPLEADEPQEPSEEEKRLVQILDEQFEAARERKKSLVSRYKFNRAHVAGIEHDEAWAGLKDVSKPSAMPLNTAARMADMYAAHLFPMEWGVKADAEGFIDETGVGEIRAKIIEVNARECDAPMQIRLAGMDAIICGEGAVFQDEMRHGNAELTFQRDIDVGEVVVFRLGPEDYYTDPNSENPDNDQWHCVVLQVPLAHLRKQGDIPQEILAKLTKKKRFGVNVSDANGLETSDGGEGCDVGMQDFVELHKWYFFADEGTFTCTTSPGYDGLVRQVEQYQGCNEGPLRIIRMQPIGGLRRGLSPLDKIMEMHLTIAALTTKLKNQALAAKSLLVGATNDIDELDKAVQAGDLASLALSNPAVLQVLKIDPVNPAILGTVEWFQNQANQSSAQQSRSVGDDGIAKTATEATMLLDLAKKFYSDMATLVQRWQTAIVRGMAWHVDKIIASVAAGEQSKTVMMDVGGRMMPMSVLPEDAEFTRDHFSWSIVTNSMQHSDPQVRLQQFMQACQMISSVIAMFAPMGGAVNVGLLAQTAAKLSGSPELQQIFNPQAMQQMQVAQAIATQQTAASQQAQGGKPAQPQMAQAGPRAMPQPAMPMGQMVRQPQAQGQNGANAY